MKKMILTALIALASAFLGSGCFKTTEADEIEQLIDDGYTLTWTNQKGEYWDEFRAEKEMISKTVVINRSQVKRDSDLNEGDANTVTRQEDGTFTVEKRE